LIEEAALRDEVELRVQDGAIVISRAERSREGWGHAAARLAARGQDRLLDAPTPTRFDEREWEW
jgi:antitoxin MazE